MWNGAEQPLWRTTVLTILAALAAPATSRGACELTVINVSGHELPGCPVILNAGRLPQAIRHGAVKVAGADGRPLASQTDDLDGDGVADEIAFLIDLPARGARNVALTPGGDRRMPPAGEALAMAKWNRANLESPLLLCEVPPVQGSVDPPEIPDVPNPFVPAETVTVRDKRGGEALMRFALASDVRYLLENATQRAVSGPVRSIVRKSRWVRVDGEERQRLRIDESLILYESDRRLDVRLDVTNLADQPQKVPPKIVLLDGELGRPLVHDLGQVRILRDVVLGQARVRIPATSRRSRRNCQLWMNPATRTGMAYIPHRPEPHGWQNEAVGRDYIRFASGPGKRVRLSKIKGDPLPPGRTRTVGFTFAFYRGEPEAMTAAYLADTTSVAGAVTVLDGGGQPLKVAAEPQHIADAAACPARWVPEPGTKAAFDEEGMVIEADARGAVSTAFTRDFASPAELRGVLDLRGSDATVEFAVEHLASGKRYKVGKPGDGSFRFSLSKALPLEGVQQCLLHLTVSPPDERKRSGGPLAVRIEKLALGRPLPGAPELAWPRDGQPLSDLGVSFTILSDAAERGYRIQVAPDKAFEKLLLDEHAPKDAISKEGGVTKHIPSRPLGKGTYWWRARAVAVGGEPGPWAAARSFTVDSTEYPCKPPVRPVSPRRPALLVTGLSKEPCRRAFAEKLKECPKPVAEMLVEQRGFLDDGDYALPVLLHYDNEVDLPQLEYAYRNFPKVIGMCFREKGLDEEYLPAVLKLSAKYGRYATTLQTEKDILLRSVLSKKFYPLMKEYGRYFIPQNKMNNRRDQMARVLTELGAYLAGRVGGWGIETEWGYAWKPMSWERALKPEMITKPVNWMPTLVLGLSTGASIYRVEGLCNSKYCYGFPRKEPYEFGPLWTRAIGPFFEDVTRYDMIPTRGQVLERVRIAVTAKPEYGLHRPSCPDTRFPNRVLAALHGVPIEGVPLQHVFEANWIPDSSRFYVVPVLPPYLPAEQRKQCREVIDPESFDTPAAAVEHANRLAPPSRSEAYAVLVGDTGVAINSIDERRDPRSGPQGMHLDLTKGPVASVQGKLGFQAYVLMKQMDDSLFLHANNFREQYTELVLRSRDGSALHADVSPADALARSEWKKDTGELSLTLNHFHGVARVTVTKENEQ